MLTCLAVWFLSSYQWQRQREGVAGGDKCNECGSGEALLGGTSRVFPHLPSLVLGLLLNGAIPGAKRRGPVMHWGRVATIGAW